MLNIVKKDQAGIKGLHNFVLCQPLNVIAKELESIKARL